MRILHINVRLLEGGAARVALDLHRQLLQAGNESRFAYGWGEKGGVSTAESKVAHSFQAGQQLQVVGNMILHGMVGIECVPPVGGGRRRLLDSILWADVIHLHAIHSYFLPFSWLVKKLIRSGKPVVWTSHDYWMLTGRCASTEGCGYWKMGCGSCPTMQNYPAAYLDYSGFLFKVKRRLISQLEAKLHVVSPSEFVAGSIKEGLPGIDVSVVSNWIDSELEEAILNIQFGGKEIDWNGDTLKVAVVANDLSDSTKVDPDLIIRLIKLPHIEIHTIGKNSPFFGERVVNHGRISQRSELVRILSFTDAAVFTSVKDTFGLVMIEALACGVPVFAIKSYASDEIKDKLGLPIVGSKEEIFSILRSFLLPALVKGMRKDDLRSNVLHIYSHKRGALEYQLIYNKLLGL